MYPIGHYVSSRLVGKEIAHAHMECPGQPHEVKTGTVANAAFDAAHVATTDTSTIGKCLL